MPGAMRKMAVYLGLVEDEVPHEGWVAPEEGAPAPVRRLHDDPGHAPVRQAPAAVHPAPGVGHVPADRVAAVPAESYRITTLHPTTYNEARAIGEHFRQGIPVIMNLTAMPDDEAKRLVDFAAGLIFGLHGAIERVTQKVFLLSPSNVEVTAEDKQRIAEGGFFNQS